MFFNSFYFYLLWKFSIPRIGDYISLQASNGFEYSVKFFCAVVV